MDETGTYYTEWSKPERKIPIQYTNAYMEFRKMVTITLCTRQQKRHRRIDQSYGLCGRGRGVEIWENSIETCIISCMKREKKKETWVELLMVTCAHFKITYQSSAVQQVKLRANFQKLMEFWVTFSLLYGEFSEPGIFASSQLELARVQTTHVIWGA